MHVQLRKFAGDSRLFCYHQTKVFLRNVWDTQHFESKKLITQNRPVSTFKDYKDNENCVRRRPEFKTTETELIEHSNTTVFGAF